LIDGNFDDTWGDFERMLVCAQLLEYELGLKELITGAETGKKVT
jgi:hypothetical protein